MLCDCGGKLRERLDFTRLEQELCDLPPVIAVGVCSSLCDSSTCAAQLEGIAGQGAARIVAGACGQEILGEGFARTLATAGFEDGMWWNVDLGEIGSPKSDDPALATEAAFERLSAAVNRVGLAEPIASESRQVCRETAVVGDGVSALQAAVALAELGHPVSLVGAGARLGGSAALAPDLFAYLGPEPEAAMENVREQVSELIAQVEDNPDIKVRLETRVRAIEGELGDFTVQLAAADGQDTLHAGAVVLATGAAGESATDAVGRGETPRVVDTTGLLDLIRGNSVPRRVAILVDVSEEQGRAVTAQVLSAAELLARCFGSRVSIYCNHIRVAAYGLEALYQRVRAQGAVITKYGLPPAVSVEDREVVLEVDDPTAGARVTHAFDLLVVADLRSVEGTDLTDCVGGLRTGPGGSPQYDDVWLLPTLTNRPGILVAGAARGNSEFRQARTDGLAAANEIHRLLGAGKLELRLDAAVVDPEKCVLCLTCMRICPHGAISIDSENEAAGISAVSCQRCGTCAAECPARAIVLPRFTDEEIAADVGRRPGVTVFACENSAVPAAAAARAAGGTYSTAVRIVRVPCTGKVDPRSMLAALEAGAERVLVLGCHPDSCQYLSGSTRALRRVERIGAMLEKAGYDRSRIEFGGIASVEPSRFVEYVTTA